MVFNRFAAQQFATHVDSMPKCIQADGRHIHSAPGSMAGPQTQDGPAWCELVHRGDRVGNNRGNASAGNRHGRPKLDGARMLSRQGHARIYV